MKLYFAIAIVFLWNSLVFAVTSQEIANRYKVIGVISEDKPGEQDPRKKGGIAVIKDTATGKTLVLKAGLPFPGQSELKITQIKKKGVVVRNQTNSITLTQKGFSGFEGETSNYASRELNNSFRNDPFERQNRRDNRQNRDEIVPGNPWPEPNNGDTGGEIPPPPPFPDEIDELFFQEFGEAPIPPEVLDDNGRENAPKPLSREELLEKYDFDPDEFSTQELENMVSPPPAPWGESSSGSTR